MRRYLLDTGIMGDFINRRRGVAERVGERVATALAPAGQWLASFGLAWSEVRPGNSTGNASFEHLRESPNGLMKRRHPSNLGG